MRALKTSLLTAFFVTGSGLAATPAFKVTANTSSTRGATLTTTNAQSRNASSRSFETQASTGSVGPVQDFRIKAIQSQKDVSGYTITDKDGSSRSLSDSFDGKELALGAGIDFTKGPWGLFIDGQSTVSNSPLERNEYRLRANMNLLSYGTDVSLSYSNVREDRPISYFVHPEDLRRTSIQGQRTERTLSADANQIINESLRLGLNLKVIQKPEDRPDAYGVRARAIVGLTDSLGAMGSFESIRERKGQLPSDGRGRFEIDSYQIGLNWEAIYDLHFKLAVGTTVEREDARGNLPKQLVGTDSVVVGFDYQFKRMTLTMSASRQEANTNYTSNSLTGGLVWEL